MEDTAAAVVSEVATEVAVTAEAAALAEDTEEVAEAVVLS